MNHSTVVTKYIKAKKQIKTKKKTVIKFKINFKFNSLVKVEEKHTHTVTSNLPPFTEQVSSSVPPSSYGPAIRVSTRSFRSFVILG